MFSFRKAAFLTLLVFGNPLGRSFCLILPRIKIKVDNTVWNVGKGNPFTVGSKMPNFLPFKKYVFFSTIVLRCDIIKECRINFYNCN